MTHLILRCQENDTAAVCGLCGHLVDLEAGNQLFRADRDEPVCHDCGRRHAPALAALVHLASAAERVGRIGRHTVFPPLTALLDLASAAEKYSRAATAGPCCPGS
jgi:hypothetical protein